MFHSRLAGSLNRSYQDSSQNRRQPHHCPFRSTAAAAQLVDEVYRLTEALPSCEQFVVTPQLRRAAWSVLNNIAEGNAKLGRREMRRFFDIVLGSLAEVDSIVAKLPGLYRLDSHNVQAVMDLRRKVDAGLLALLRSDGR